MDALKFFGRRFLHSIFVFLTIVTLLFFLFRLMPGDPTMLFIAPEMSVDAIDQIRRLFGLDQPLYIQYFKYIANIFTGNYGVSYYYMEPAAPIVFESLQNTLILTVPAMCLSYLIGVIGGTLLATIARFSNGMSCCSHSAWANSSRSLTSVAKLGASPRSPGDRPCPRASQANSQTSSRCTRSTKS